MLTRSAGIDVIHRCLQVVRYCNLTAALVVQLLPARLQHTTHTTIQNRMAEGRITEISIAVKV